MLISHVEISCKKLTMQCLSILAYLHIKYLLSLVRTFLKHHLFFQKKKMEQLELNLKEHCTHLIDIIIEAKSNKFIHFCSCTLIKNHRMELYLDNFICPCKSKSGSCIFHHSCQHNNAMCICASIRQSRCDMNMT